MDLIEIARLEELRRARSAPDTADEVRAIEGGGVACRGKPGAWINYAVGMGLSGTPVPRRELEEIVAWYESKGIEPRLEVAPFVDRAMLKDCAELGFGVRDCGNVLYREVSRGEMVRPVVEGAGASSRFGRLIGPTSGRCGSMRLWWRKGSPGASRRNWKWNWARGLCGGRGRWRWWR